MLVVDDLMVIFDIIFENKTFLEWTNVDDDKYFRIQIDLLIVLVIVNVHIAISRYRFIMNMSLTRNENETLLRKICNTLQIVHTYMNRCHKYLHYFLRWSSLPRYFQRLSILECVKSMVS